MRFLQDFKTFALKGNVIDLAVGVIIGSAFSTIVTSIVKDLIMPIVSLATGGIDFSQHFIKLGHLPDNFKGNPASLQDLQAAGVAVLGYGNFLTVMFNFIILAFIIFMMVKAISKLQHTIQQSVEEAATVPTPEDILLLRDIRDTLKSSKQTRETRQLK